MGVNDDVVSRSQWTDHRTADDGHVTEGGRVWGVTPYRYTDCDRYGCKSMAVLDPEDAEQVKRLVKQLSTGAPIVGLSPANQDLIDAAWVKHAQSALREFANPTPPKPEVYAHVVASMAVDGVQTALCGKVWKPVPEVTVVGRCPECTTQSGRWTA